MSSSPLKIRTIYNYVKKFGVRSTKSYSDCAHSASSPQETKKAKNRKFKPCTSSEPHKSKEVWVDRLQLPYYQDFGKIKGPPVNLERDLNVDARLRVAPNPKPVGIGLTRQEIMDEKLKKLIEEYHKQREYNIIASKTQILGGKEPDSKIPEIKVQEKRKEQEDDGSKVASKTSKGSGVLRAV